MNKKKFFIGLLLTTTAFSLRAIDEISSAIKKSNPDAVRSLLEKGDISSEQKERFVQRAEEQTDQAKQELTKPNLKDAMSLTAGSAGLYCSVASSVCAAVGVFFCIVNARNNEFEIDPVIIAAAGVAGLGIYGYFGGSQLFNGLTNGSRKKKLINALAIENIMHSIKPK